MHIPLGPRGGGYNNFKEEKSNREGGGRDKDRKREEHRKRGTKRGRGTERKSGAGREFHDMGVREGTNAVVAN